MPVAADLEKTLLDLERTAAAEFSGEGVDPRTLSFSRSADVRYVGQVHEINVPLVGEVLDDGGYVKLLQRFHALHRERFGHAQPGDPVELINLRVLARGRTPHPSPTATIEGKAAPLRHRRAWFAGSWRDVPVYAGLTLPSATILAGPALVELPTSTIVVPEDFSLTLSRGGDYLLKFAGAGSGTRAGRRCRSIRTARTATCRRTLTMLTTDLFRRPAAADPVLAAVIEIVCTPLPRRWQRRCC